MHTLLEKAWNTIKRESLFCNGDVVYAAVSGGADSVALLYVLCQLRQALALKEIRALHVHHGIRGETADRDERFVRQLCRSLDVPLSVTHVDTPREAKTAGESLEEAGRRLRYAFFESSVGGVKNAKIATAHNADDLVETVLFHMIRGCGTAGLTGIPVRRDNIVRPLIECSAEEIRSFCKEQGLSYMTDETNTDLSYARNRIRHEVLPSMQAINDRVKDHIGALSSVAKDEDHYLQTIAHDMLMSAVAEDNRIAIDPLKTTDPVILKRLIKEAARSYGGVYAEHKHIDALCSVLFDGGSVTLPDGVIARSNGQYLSFHKPKERNALFDICMTVKPHDTVTFAEEEYAITLLDRDEYEKIIKINKKLFHFCVSYDIIYGTLLLRCRKTGDAFRPYKRHCTKTLKKWFNEQSIPVDERERIPILCDDNGILAIVGYDVDERAQVSDHTKTVLMIEKIQRKGM